MSRLPLLLCVVGLAVMLVGCPLNDTETDTGGTGAVAAAESGEDGPSFSEGVTEVDEFAPDFTVLDTDGNAITKADYSGKILILDFWSSTCTGCIDKLKEYKPIIAEYEAKGVELVAVSRDTKPEVAAASAKQHEFEYLIAMSNTEIEAGYFPGEDMIVIPQARIIDRDGNLRFEFGPGSTVEDMSLALAQLADETVGGDEELSEEVLSEAAADEPVLADEDVPAGDPEDEPASEE